MSAPQRVVWCLHLIYVKWVRLIICVRALTDPSSPTVDDIRGGVHRTSVTASASPYCISETYSRDIDPVHPWRWRLVHKRKSPSSQEMFFAMIESDIVWNLDCCNRKVQALLSWECTQWITICCRRLCTCKSRNDLAKKKKNISEIELWRAMTISQYIRANVPFLLEQIVNFVVNIRHRHQLNHDRNFTTSLVPTISLH